MRNKKAIVNGRIITVTQGTLEKGALLIEDGKIRAIGTNISIPGDAEIIDATGKVVMPGMIDAHSHLGIFGEGIGVEHDDGNESTDPVTPHLRAIDAVNPRDAGFADAVAGGVTTVMTGPGSANVVGGLAAAIKTHGRNIDEMVLAHQVGLKIAFGENPKRVYGEHQKKMPATRMGTAGLLRETLVKAQNYLAKLEKGKKNPEKLPERDLRMEALVRVLRREIPLRAHAHQADDMLTAIRIAEEFNLRLVIEHGTEAHLLADVLAAKRIPVVAGPFLVSRAKVELRERSFATPGILSRAGVKVAIMTDHPVIPVQYLPVCAALAVREGMDEDEAMRAITINAAEILGLSHRIGSLEAGKDADIVIASGSILEIRARVEMVLIGGKTVYCR